MFKMRAKIISVGLLGTAAMLPLDFAKADQVGHASWYSLPANTTANGERMNPDELTAAHRSLPFGTRVLVENLTNGRSVVVRINDRGPFIGGRIIDLSKAAAESIGMLAAGTAQVRITTTAPDGGSALACFGRSHRKGEEGRRARGQGDCRGRAASCGKTCRSGTGHRGEEPPDQDRQADGRGFAIAGPCEDQSCRRLDQDQEGHCRS